MPVELSIDDIFAILSDDLGVFDLEWDGKHGVLFPSILCVTPNDRTRISSMLQIDYPGSLFGVKGPAWDYLSIWKKYRDLAYSLDGEHSREMVWGASINREAADRLAKTSSEIIWQNFSEIERFGYLADVASGRNWGYRGIGNKFRDRYLALASSGIVL